MTADKFLEILALIREVDSRSKLQAALEAISVTLTNLTNSPAEPTYQSSLATSLQALESASSKSSDGLSVSDLKAIASMGGEEYFDSNLSTNVRTVIANNAMTPSVARDFVQNLATKRGEFLQTVKRTRDGLEELGVSGYALNAGGSDLSFTIPRDLFSNELSKFSAELRFLDKLLQDLSEGVLGHRETAKLESLSTTIPVVSVLTDPHVLEALAKTVQFFLDAWKKIEDIRKVRSEVARLGISGTALSEFDDKIEETVTTVVEETVKFSLVNHSNDDARKNELNTALSQDFRRLFGQIERGLVVEFRAEPDEAADLPADSDPLLTVRDISKILKYPAPELQPLLLTSGELLEGEITRTVKKSTTTSTTKSGHSKKTTV